MPTIGILMTVARIYPVATQVISSTDAPREPRMYGSATLMMLESSAAMMVPSITVSVMIHLSDFAMSCCWFLKF